MAVYEVDRLSISWHHHSNKIYSRSAKGGDFAVFSASELQTNSSAHHGPVSEVYVRIVIELPKPFWTIVVDAHADVANEFTGFSMSRFEKAIKGNAVVPIEFVTPEDMSVLLLRVQTDIENSEC